MANFYLYKYQFEQSMEPDLFATKNVQLNQAKQEEMINSLLNPPEGCARTLSNLYSMKVTPKGEPEPEIYTNDILKHHKGITLLQVKNNRTKTVIPIDSNDAKKVGHYPYCYVIIDTRAESTSILVQQNSAFTNPDIVAEALINYFKAQLQLSFIGWTITYKKRKCKGVIWDIVRTRTKGNKDRVSELSFKFSSKRQPTGDNKIDAYCKDALHFFSSEEGELKLYSSDSSSRMLDETNEDLKRTVNLLIDNQYKIKVGFEKSGSYEYGKDAFAIYGVEDNVCKAFEEDKPELFGCSAEGLIEWLDKIMPEDDSIEYTEPSTRRRRSHAAAE